MALSISALPQGRWRKRMNRGSLSTLEKITDGMVSGMKMMKTEDGQTAVCGACQLGKLHRNPFCLSDSRTTSFSEVFHPDHIGPIAPPSPNDIDDTSWKPWTFLLTRKSNAFEVSKAIRVQVERETGVKMISRIG